jgi:hypothetical protein
VKSPLAKITPRAMAEMIKGSKESMEPSSTPSTVKRFPKKESKNGCCIITPLKIPPRLARGGGT